MLSQRPRALAIEDPRADVLADVIGASLLHNALYRRIECGAPWGMAIPRLERATFYVVLRGSARVEVEGQAPEQLSAGDTLFLPHGAAHVIRDSKQTLPVRVIDGSQTVRASARRLGGTGPKTTLIKGFFQFIGRKPSLLEGLPPVMRLLAEEPAHRQWAAATLDLLLAEAAAPGPASVFVLQRLADVLFVQTLRALIHTRGSGLDAHRGIDRRSTIDIDRRSTLGIDRRSTIGIDRRSTIDIDDDVRPSMEALADPAIHESLSAMHANVAHPWTVASLAKTVRLSRSAFAARFTALVREPPLQYLARWRVGRAAESLRETRKRVSEIAHDVGYESVPSFNKAFHRWQGMSPSAFRARYGALDQRSNVRIHGRPR